MQLTLRIVPKQQVTVSIQALDTLRQGIMQCIPAELECSLLYRTSVILEFTVSHVIARAVFFAKPTTEEQLVSD